LKTAPPRPTTVPPSLQVAATSGQTSDPSLSVVEHELFTNELNKGILFGIGNACYDGTKCHVSDESFKIMDEEVECDLMPLPPNSTSVTQPLDVGVMGPLKAKLRSLWLKETPVASAEDKRRCMIRRVIDAWDDIKSTTIARSFEKALPKSSSN